MSEESLRRSYRRAILGFYLRPKIVWSLLRHLRNLNWWPRIGRGMLTMLGLKLGRRRRQTANAGLESVH